MGIDVYTGSLALQLRHFDLATASALRRGERHPLTAAGTTAARRGVGPMAGTNPWPPGAYWLARRLRGELGVPTAGNPWSAMGPVFTTYPDKMAPRGWLQLRAVVARRADGQPLEDAVRAVEDDWARSSAPPDDDGPGRAPLPEPPEEGIPLFDAAWDNFPGVAFGRAVAQANSLVVPSEESVAFASGHAAIVSAGEGRAFLEALAEHLGVDVAHFTEDYDPELPEALNALFYNPRLLWFHVQEVQKRGSVLGIWG